MSGTLRSFIIYVPEFIIKEEKKEFFIFNI